MGRKAATAEGLCQVEFSFATSGGQWGYLKSGHCYTRHTEGEGTGGRETSLEAAAVT